MSNHVTRIVATNSNYNIGDTITLDVTNTGNTVPPSPPLSQTWRSEIVRDDATFYESVVYSVWLNNTPNLAGTPRTLVDRVSLNPLLAGAYNNPLTELNGIVTSIVIPLDICTGTYYLIGGYEWGLLDTNYGISQLLTITGVTPSLYRAKTQLI